MAEIPNRGVKSIKKISDIDKKQKKDNFIFCVSQKMNLFKKTKEKRYFWPPVEVLVQSILQTYNSHCTRLAPSALPSSCPAPSAYLPYRVSFVTPARVHVPHTQHSWYRAFRIRAGNSCAQFVQVRRKFSNKMIFV